MQDDLWERIERFHEKAGITYTNFAAMKSRGSVPDKWHGKIHLASKGTDYEISIEQLETIGSSQNASQ